MDLRAADVLFKDRIAGRLSETANGGTRFIYGADWGERIACTFPILQREHEWPNGLHPFFQHLGPEGWLREEQARSAHVQQEDDFGLLLRYGADCIGAVGLRPADAATRGFEITEAVISPGRTISGIQKKLLVVKDGNAFRPAEQTGPAPYIAKFNSERISTLVRNEFLSLRWTAALLGAQEVNEFTLATIALGNERETVLVLTRFDRTPDGEKLRLEDFAQILNRPRGADYAGKYDASYEEAANVIRTFSALPIIDLARFFRRIIAFTLIGNCDAHLKNFSLLETPTGLRLSPIYDVLNTAYYAEYNQALALTIDGKSVQFEAVNRALLQAFGRSIGLGDRAIAQIFDELKMKAKRAAKVLVPPQGEGPEGFVTRFSEIVSGACLRILEK